MLCHTCNDCCDISMLARTIGSSSSSPASLSASTLVVTASSVARGDAAVAALGLGGSDPSSDAESSLLQRSNVL